jgi:hypothetical protein
MARIRTIKPEFWTDEKLAECSLPARLLFIGLWNFADDEGRMDYSPKRIKMQVFPGDNIHVTRLIAELERIHVIQVYEIDGRSYLLVPNFRKHQNINRPNPSRLPAPNGSFDHQEVISEESSTTDRDRQAVQQVWDYYIATIGKSPSLYTFTDKRIRMGNARLGDLLLRPKLENAIILMKLCVDRLAGSAFHNG